MDKKYLNELQISLIGSYAINQDVFDSVEHLVSEELFEGMNRTLYNLVRTNFEKGLVSDVMLINTQLSELHFEKGSITKVINGFLNPTSPTNVAKHVLQLFEEYTKNYLAPVLAHTSESIQQGNDIFDAIDEVKNSISKIEYKLHNVSKEKSIDQIFQETKDEIEADCKKTYETLGEPTGLKALDKLSGGLINEVIVIGATPGSGKTALLVNIIYQNVVVKRNHVMFFSLEMTAKQITKRLFSHGFEINSNKIKRGDLLDEELEQIRSFKAPQTLMIDETSGITWQYVEAKIRKIRKDVPMDKIIIVMIDYIQRMSSSSDELKLKNHDTIISIRMNKLADIQKKYNCCMIELSQLSRDVTKKSTPRPIMSDLKESGSIEANAHQVWMLYRPDMHEKDPTNEKGESLKGLCEIGIIKNREGERGYVYSRFLGQYSKYEPFVPEAAQEKIQETKDIF